ncbi:MAG: hypothetical protein HY539_04770 [Deltaproteobacteria bacterium]|nr:hypothetical protein [Deltaproteobacteria bacterium]MBI4197116.1 hypothetical protein [Deltaproteobacteria bacterium]
MKIRSLPKEILAEVLRAIADYEKLDGLQQVVSADFSLEETRTALRELAVQLREEAVQEKMESDVPPSRESFSDETRNLLARLSPREEKRLLKAFGFFEI